MSTPDPASLPVTVRSLAQIVRQPDWTYALFHSVDQHRLIWITRGQGRVAFDGGTFTYGPNSVLFIPAGTLHRIDLKATVFGTILEADATRVSAMPTDALHLRVRDAMAQGKFVGLVENLQKELSSPADFAQDACLLHVGLIGVWLQRTTAESQGSAKKDAARRLTATYMNRVATGFADGGNVQSFADDLNVTTTHLTRCCRAGLGQSALAVLNERIFQEARSLLAYTRVPIRQVASALGFSSSAYFTRSFQHATGSTPTAFRAKYNVA